MPGKISTHVLDTAQGVPAADVAIELWYVNPTLDEKQHLKTIRTNSDGRTDTPLLMGAELQVGVYELVFFVGDYFAKQTDLPTPRFLDRIPIRFGIADTLLHYHVPLLVSPWSYSTYRGS